MPLKNVHYQKLETEDSDEGPEDESPPTHVELGPNSHNIKGNRWNHIDNLDEFFERVYDYQQQNGLLTIFVSDVLELVQFLFMVLFAAFIVTCLRFENLWVDTIEFTIGNETGERNVKFEDLFEVDLLTRINPIVMLFLLMALAFWIHRLVKTIIRFYRFWEIRTFYTEALNIPPSELRSATWADVIVRLKQAQRDFKMNIQKQELTELDVYHRILRFRNYMVAMVNKSVLPCKIWIPFYGDKVFFTQGLKFNFELLLFWSSLKAPFKNSFYLREEYKSASNKSQLIKNLRFRISLLALINLVFCPVIFLYQLLYAFFSYAEIVKRQPGTFGKRRWSLYGKLYLRDFNELDHELLVRLNRAYKPSVKYMDLFTHPLVSLLARNVAFFAGSIFAVLLTLTVIQEDLLTASNVLKILTALGLIITVCRGFIPNENQVWCPSELMQQILGNIHYMPDHWKQQPQKVEVYKEFTHVFQFTVMYIMDEVFSPLVTPFILYFVLRNRAGAMVDFLRNFTIDVSGVGDVCSFAEMNVRKHGSPEWLSAGVTRAEPKEQAELGKTEISLVQFSRKNPNWKPTEDGTAFMSHLKESADEMHQSISSHHSDLQPDSSLTFLSTPPSSLGHQQRFGDLNAQGTFEATAPNPFTTQTSSMERSIWGVHHGHHVPPQSALIVSDNMTESTLQLHMLHDHKKSQSADWTFHSARFETSQTPPNPAVTSYSSDSDVHLTMDPEQGLSEQEHRQEKTSALEEPLLQPSHMSELPSSREHESSGGDMGGVSQTHGRPHNASANRLQKLPSGRGTSQAVGEGIGSQPHSGSWDTTNVEIHDHSNQ